MDSTLFKRFDKAAEKAGIKRNTDESIEWFRSRVRKDKTTFKKVQDGLKNASRLEPGQMLTYTYDAKTKAKLPFWDMFPLIIFLEKTKDGWYGANLHYLPPRARANLFKELAIGKRSHSAIARALTKNNLTKHCLKRYLVTHLVTKPKIIPMTEWDIAVNLPFEGFQKASKKQVWRNAR